MNEVSHLRGGSEPMTFHNIEAEQAVLGAILVDNSVVDQVGDVLQPEFFADPVHRRIFEIATGRIRKGHLASPITMKLDLETDEGLRALGGPAYLIRLAGAAMVPAAREYAKLIVEAAARRTLHQIAAEADSRLQTGEDSQTVRLAILHALQGLPEGQAEESSYSLAKAMVEATHQAVAAYQGDTAFLKTGVGVLDAIIRGLAPGDLCLIAGATSMGKAQPLDSLVLSERGWKRMGDIKVGDRLASVDGSPSEVLGVYPQGEKAIFKVTLSDGRHARCCADHLWEVCGSAVKGKNVVSTSRLMDMMQTKTAKGRVGLPLFRGEFGEAVAHNIDPWLLGAFIGNGHFPDAGSPIFSTADASTLWRLNALLADTHEVVAASGYDYRIKGRNGGGNAFAAEIERLGLRGCRAETKFIPDEYLRADTASRTRLLQGLLDTDGWVEKFGAVRFSTSSPVLADQVAGVVRSLGGVCSISKKAPKFTYMGENRTGQDHFTLNIRHDDAGQFFSVIAKKRRCQRSRPVRLNIAKIEPDGFEAAQCIMVSHQRGLYVTDGFAVTHNTSLALEIASNVAYRGDGVAFVSLEMTRQELATRMASAISRVPYTDLRDPATMTEDSFRKWIEATTKVSQGTMRIIPRHIRDIPAIHAAVSRAGLDFKSGKPALVVIDYAQLVRGQGKGRYEQMTEVSIGLKQMAGMLEVPVVALCQLSRDIGGREDKRPQLSDIKETGQFENDADQVVFCHREGYWLQRQGPRLDKNGQVTDQAKTEWQADISAVQNVMELIVRKNRHGRLATAEIGFHDATGRFWDLKKQHEIEGF